MVKLEADLEQTKHMARKRHDRAGEARTWDGKARAGYGRIMSKKDMTSLTGRPGHHVVAQRVVINLSRQVAVIASL